MIFMAIMIFYFGNDDDSDDGYGRGSRDVSRGASSWHTGL